MKSVNGLWVFAGLFQIINTKAINTRTTGGKRGLAFAKSANNAVNQGRSGAEYTQYFAGYSQITWMYDWEGVIDGRAIDLEYVPMLRDDQKVFTDGWADAVAYAQQHYGTKYILSFNEPDQCDGGGTCMDIDRAVQAHRKFLQPLAGLNLGIGTPAVTYGLGPGKGLNWLKEFMARCSDCQIDFVAVHWYAWDHLDDFKNYMQVVHQTFCKPLWITEFGVDEGDADEFLRHVLPWMDQQAWIQRYAYYLVAPSIDQSQYLIDAPGAGLSSTGRVYATA